ncbi:protein-glutamine gamma-glutamyltransferase 4 [Lagopus muta]|uniref:protein-glutamine gamma-glutamyltransferase 4 n=1 Tax=Lagopus muta TaxID=64668 RepID=UPI00209EBA56|nr:protein-glutamine gamma-glutamyltransferase 4 [Lagopus muta]
MNQDSDLKVTNVDFLKSQNSVQHHTDAYDTSNLVVRRGQPFLLQLTLSRELRAADKLALHFSIGEKPMEPTGTLMSLNPRSTRNVSGWQISIIKSSGTECILSVTSAPNAAVGIYGLIVQTGPNIYKPETNAVYLLFNPWCEGDIVFLSNEAERKEYILNDTGYIYVGSAFDIHSKPWNFGQFEESILDACMYLLDKSKLKMSSRRDPVVVSRAMSALVNANDDNGVVMGNWSGKYENGTSPMAWIGSVAILQQYYKTKKPVCYGQCWVFSGVLTTVMRCLGIPARSVSNFNSAHDTDENLRVDVYLNEKGEKMKWLSSDSVWNFHVWNDVWMKRKDLPSGFDGWQAIDATPQEQSLGIFQCGPCPVKAVKDGDVYLPYDSKFVYAEVNADKVYWRVTEENGRNQYTKLGVESRSVGANISTKAVGQNRREDITWEYKFPEGSSEERASMKRAVSYLQPSGMTPRSHFAAVPKDVSLRNAGEKNMVQNEVVPKSGVQLEITNEKPLCPGNPIEVVITVKSTVAGSWTVDLASSCQLQSYTGKVHANLGYIKQTVKVEGQSEVRVPLKIMPDDYMKALATVDDEEHVHVTAIAEIQGTPEKLTKEVSLSFEYPPIQVQMPETAQLNKDFTCAFIFKNRLNIPMDNCKLMVEGLGIFKMATFDEGDIQPGRIIKSEVICTPTRVGEKKIVARLTSNQVKDISVEKGITVTH